MAIVYENGVVGKTCTNPKCGWKSLEAYSPRRLLGIPVGDGFKSRCRDCFNVQKRSERAAKPDQYRTAARTYTEANKEHIRDLKRAHQASNPESYSAALKRYQESHREELNAKAKERRESNPEHAREIGRKSREKHADERNAYQRNYGKSNRDKLTLFTNRRRARKHEAAGTHTDKEWQLVKEQYKFTCLACGKREPEIKLTRDHVVPLEKGGTDSIDNIQPLCARCNSRKNNKHIDYR